jgi:outer membrane protein TolC
LKRFSAKSFAAAGLAALIAVGPVAAQEGQGGPKDTGGTRQIGLRDALKLAVRQNPSLASETVDVDIANARIASTYGLEDWLLDGELNGSVNRTRAVQGESFPAEGSESYTGRVAISKGFSDGGRLGVRFEDAFTRTDATVPIINDMGMITGFTDGEIKAWNPALSLTFFQPLLRGFGEDNQLDGARVRARAERTVAELDRQNAAANIVRSVIDAYWELSFSAQQVEIRKESLALAREQLRITRAGIEVGKLARTESLAIEQAIAAREEELLLAEQDLVEKSIELRRLVGLEIGPGELELSATDRLESKPVEPELDGSLNKAMGSNAQLKAVRAQGDAAVLEVVLSDNGLLPQLDFQAAGGPTGRSEEFGDSISRMGQFETFGVTAGLTFSMNLGNDAAKGQKAVAQQNVRRVKFTEADVKAQIAAQVVRAVNLVRSAKKRMEVAAKATQLAEQNVTVEKARWEVGRTTNFEVLRRQEELSQSRLREARAQADYLKAVATLDWLTGDLLPRYGIDLQ